MTGCPVKVTIIYPYDPFEAKAGGIEMFINMVIQHAPEDFEFAIVGVTAATHTCRPRCWLKKKIGDREVRFFPLFADDGVRKIIPLTLRFVVALAFVSSAVGKDRVLFFNGIELASFFRRSTSPKVVVFHNDIQQIVMGESRWRRFPWLYFRYIIFMLPCFDRVYTVSMHTLDFFYSHSPQQKEKISFLPTCVDTKIFYPPPEGKEAVRQKLHREYPALSLDKKWILFIGRLEKQKDPLLLLETFRFYQEKQRDAVLVIVGNGGLKNELFLYVQKNELTPSVLFLDSIPHQRTALLYQAANAFLLTSLFEGMPLVVLEALACGLPVVSTRVGEVHRVIHAGITGKIVEKRNALLLSQALEEVLHHSSADKTSSCVQAIAPYTVQNVLGPLYKTMRDLSRA